MHDEKTVQRFIDLRVQGWPFTRIAGELQVAKSTLILWSRQHEHDIANLRAIEREHRLSQLLASSEERLDKLAARLHTAEAELAKRDLTALSTGRLLSLVETLHSRIRREAGPVQFVTSVDAIPENEYADRIHVWKS